MKNLCLAIVPTLFFTLTPLIAGEKSPTSVQAAKGEYHLFNPVPRDEMRGMSTDRPDQTESAYTVDAGHIQIETGLLSMGIDRRNADEERVFGINAANLNLKLGLLHNTDLQLVVENYLYERVTVNGNTQSHSGFGDLTTRVKINLWGNDGGATALAIMPFVKFPTATGNFGNGHVEGGIIVPLAVELPHGWRMGLMTELDIVHRDDGGHGTDFINSITFSHSIAGDLGGYVECFTNLSRGEVIVMLDAGLTYALTEDIQLDCGCNFGVTENAEDFNPFLGLSVRF